MFERFVVLPPHASIAIALWTLHTHALEAAQYTPRLALLSPPKRCGKSIVLALLEALVRRPLATANATVAAVFRAIDEHQPTLLIDEADSFLQDRSELRGVLNAGHRRGGTVLRCTSGEGETRQFDVFAPVAIAAIGRLPDTLMGRSIVVRMKRARLANGSTSSDGRSVGRIRSSTGVAFAGPGITLAHSRARSPTSPRHSTTVRSTGGARCWRSPRPPARHGRRRLKPRRSR